MNSRSAAKKKKKKQKAHLFGLAAGRSQQEGVENVLPSQEEAIAVLIQEDGSEGELAVVTAEDGRSVGGQQVCRDGGEKGELWHPEKREEN